MFEKVTISSADINTGLLIHGTPGVLDVETLDTGTLIWQVRIVDALIAWSGRANEPIRILATVFYRSAITHEDPYKTMDHLERHEWTIKSKQANFGRYDRQIIAQITPRIQNNHIELIGRFTLTNNTPLFADIPTSCETWKHVALRINQCLARIGRSHAHHWGVKPLSITAYPDILFGNHKTFLDKVLKHRIPVEQLPPKNAA